MKNDLKSISINGQFVRINETIEIDLKCKVGASLLFGEHLIIVLDWKSYQPLKQNVKCYNLKGDQVWTIEPGEWPFDSSCPVTGVWAKDNRLFVYRSCGFTLELDPATGAVLDEQFTK